MIDSRLRKLVGPLVPQPPRPWSERIPLVSEPEKQRYLTDLAAALDAAKTGSANTSPNTRRPGRRGPSARISADHASLAAIRARAEERIARERGQGELAERHGGLARSWAAMEAFYRRQEAELEQTMEVRREWEQATEQSRRQALAADSELRRRYPLRRFEPLRSAEPTVSQDEHDLLVLTPGESGYKQPAWIAELAEERRAARLQLAERRSVEVPAADPASGYEGKVWPTWMPPDRDAILQPPKPEIRPAAAVLERAAEVEAGR